MLRIAGTNARGARRSQARDAPARDEQRQRQQRGEARDGKYAGDDADGTTSRPAAASREIKPDGAPAPEPHDEVALADEAVLMEIGNRVDHGKRHDQQSRHQRRASAPHDTRCVCR